MKFATLVTALCSMSRRGALPLLSAALIPAAHGQPATNVELPAPAQGSAAISALGAHLPDVAKAYGLDAQGLVTLLQTQPSLGVDTRGALLFACAGLAVSPQPSTTATDGTANALTTTSSVMTVATGTAVDVFKLHSMPGVTRVIYLDFDGHTTSGTSWNSAYTGGAPIVSTPFDQDGDPTTFSESERAVIQRIWQRVAEDYAPFAVDVTTEDPGIEGLRKTSSGDNAYGIRVVISPTNFYGNAGGVGYIGSFNWDSDTPCFAFTQQLANGEKYIAECSSHESGHTLGLYHDGLGGSSPTEYYQGQGNWAPIMGNSYYRGVTQFSRGEYANANNTQDDYAVISSYVPIATDDHGNTLATATALAGTNIATGGTIETRNDVDVFRFDTGAGTISLNVQGPAPETDLDIKAELLNSNGQVLQTSDDTSVLSASIAATLNAGTYYLRISCVGNGDPVTTGYSTYASVGNYIITGTLISTGLKQAPVAAITASTLSGTAPLSVSFSGQNSSDSDGTIASYQWSFGTGDTATGVTSAYTYSAAGSYSAVLTVVDNDGLVGTASVTINVLAPANIAPTAVASASTTSGTAPVPVTFSSAGSSDPDGSITSYKWDFGDGTSSTAASPSKTYSTPGNYNVKLTVTDNAGASAASAVSVSVLGNSAYDVDVYSLNLTPTTSKSGTTAAAVIVIMDRNSRAVAGATVNLQWSGVVSGGVIGKTDSAGRLTLTSQRTKKTGTLTATITGVTPPTANVYDTSIFTAATAQSVVLK